MRSSNQTDEDLATFSEVGREVGVGREGARLLLESALRKLRKAPRARMLRDFVDGGGGGEGDRWDEGQDGNGNRWVSWQGKS